MTFEPDFDPNTCSVYGCYNALTLWFSELAAEQGKCVGYRLGGLCDEHRRTVTTVNVACSKHAPKFCQIVVPTTKDRADR